MRKTALQLSDKMIELVACRFRVMGDATRLRILQCLESGEGGNLIYLERMDDVQIASVEISRQKAYAAVAYKRPTKYFHDGLAGGNTSLLKLPGLIMTEGGVPLIVDGRVIGGIGISGGAPPKDHEIAQATADALSKIIGQQ